MKKWQTALLFIAILIILIMAFSQYTKNNEQTNLMTDDGYKIAYDYHYVSDKGIILVHMLGHQKEDWKDIASFLNKKGYSTIAIDLRGHGKSQGSLNNFNDKDFQNMKYDLKAAKNFLVQKGINKITIIGASMGANLALNYSASSDIKRIVLLSPGENYHNVKTFDTIKNYNGSVLIVASKDDSQSYSASEYLDKNAIGNHKLIIYETGGHGTQMFLGHPELKETILDFINQN